MNPSLPVLDPSAIENLRAINPDDGGEFLRELIEIFLADTPKHFADIETALAARQAPDLTRAAHSIKGSSGNFGATALAALARDIEAMGKVADFAGATQALPALRAEFERLTPVLVQLKSA
ncbi:MAG TPA: Hpt domain-containing protein [Candidatus Didemnitutus sp.]|nr:Hpt domain-containing protein [Candidatus Didemnitutus sp.]